MDKEKRVEVSSYVGGIMLFVSCWGVSIYDQYQHGEYATNQDKMSFEAILASSWITGLVIGIVTWLFLTLYDCYKNAKKEDENMWVLFKKELFCKKTILTLLFIIIFSILAIFLGLLFIGLAFFLMPLLKKKF